jgi:hypothetical protein
VREVRVVQVPVGNEVVAPPFLLAIAQSRTSPTTRLAGSVRATEEVPPPFDVKFPAPVGIAIRLL